MTQLGFEPRAIRPRNLDNESVTLNQFELGFRAGELLSKRIVS